MTFGKALSSIALSTILRGYRRRDAIDRPVSGTKYYCGSLRPVCAPAASGGLGACCRCVEMEVAIAISGLKKKKNRKVKKPMVRQPGTEKSNMKTPQRANSRYQRMALALGSRGWGSLASASTVTTKVVVVPLALVTATATATTTALVLAMLAILSASLPIVLSWRL